MNHAYAAARGLVNNIPFGPSVFPTTIESVTVPPGDYAVSATGTMYPGETLACTLANSASGNWYPEGRVSYALTAAVSMPNGGQIALDCSGPAGDNLSPGVTDNTLIAIAVDAIN